MALKGAVLVRNIFVRFYCNQIYDVFTQYLGINSNEVG